MCGIAGIISTVKNVNGEQLRQAVQCLKHRGPEGEGIWTDSGHIALGHRRLSIIDLSEAAAQPMVYKDRFVIVHNGELYNYLELKKELKDKGCIFSNHSDTEVILAAYSTWGPSCVQRFDGMFSFAIWDKQERKLFAARDRFGEKPFFFSFSEGGFLFASEIKALWSMGVKKSVNRGMLYNFLTIGYTSNPSEQGESFFEDVQKLPSACFLTYDYATGRLEIENYWQAPLDVVDMNEGDAIEKFTALFKASLGRRLRSDVAIGSSLSGGLDSASIVAFCENIATERYSHKCFTASFPGFEQDESKKAAELAARFSLQHHLVEIRETEIVTLMEKVMHQQEEPFSSASVLAQYKVFEAAKNAGVTVLLDGQGADETMAGYHKYYRWYWQELYRKNRGKLASEIKAARAAGVTEAFSWKHRLSALMPELSGSLLQTRKSNQASRHVDLDRDFAFAQKRNLYYSLPATQDLNGALFFNSFLIGLDELLRLADRNSMANAVEVRLPYLSHELVEFLFSLPPSLKIRNGYTKWLLRKAVEEKLPLLAWQTKKIGFEPPQKLWMQNKEVQEAIRDGKKKLVQNGILNANALKKLAPHEAYGKDNSDWKYWSASFLF